MFKVPCNEQAEKAVLGALINEPNLIDECIVTEDDFYRETNKYIFMTLKAMVKKSISIDFVTVMENLQDVDFTYINDCTVEGINSTNIKHWERIVIDKSIKRKQLLAAQEIIEAVNKDEDPTSIFIKAQDFDSYFDGELEGTDTITIKTMQEINDHLENKTTPGIKTNIKELDYLLDGFKDGGLYYLGARPSIGKTALALQIIKNVAEENKKIAFFSLEMSKTALVKRLIVNHSRTHLNLIKERKIDEQGLKSLNDAASKLYRQNIFISDKGGQTVESILSKAKRHKKKHGLDMLFIDHFHILENSSMLNNANERSTYNSRMLKYMAKELEIPVVCLVQLNRKLEERPKSQRMPIMSDVRDSGSLEQDADVIIFLDRQDYWFKDDEDYTPNNIADIKIAKNRDGETGRFSMKFYGGTQRFEQI